eukprot:g4579.t1
MIRCRWPAICLVTGVAHLTELLSVDESKALGGTQRTGRDRRPKESGRIVHDSSVLSGFSSDWVPDWVHISLKDINSTPETSASSSADHVHYAWREEAYSASRHAGRYTALTEGYWAMWFGQVHFLCCPW